MHRAFFAADGEFRAGPGRLVQIAEQIDSYVFDEALALFLCAPQALCAVNKHVRFDPYRSSFELAETQVDEQHWPRRTDQGAASISAPRVDFAGGSAGNAC